MKISRVPDFKWLIDKGLFPIPIIPSAGDVVDAENIEAWVRWAYECGKSDGINLGLNAKNVLTFTAE